MENVDIYIRCAVRLGMSLVCALALGLERKKQRHTVGLRAIIPITLSCALLCILSSRLAETSPAHGGDPTRIAAGVVSGIGFIGGGAIMRQGLNVRGLTSAAVIWTAAAEGLACGAGLFAPAIAVLAVVIIALVALEKTEGHFSSEKTKAVKLSYKGGAIDGAKVKSALTERGCVARDVNISRDFERDTTTVEYYVKAPPALDELDLCRALERTGELSRFSISDCE